MLFKVYPQGVGGGCSQRVQLQCACARYGATPRRLAACAARKHRTLSVGARVAAVSVAPESPTVPRRCTQIYPQNCKWKMPTADAMLLSPAVGASARAKVVFGCENSSQSSGNNHVSPGPNNGITTNRIDAATSMRGQSTSP